MRFHRFYTNQKNLTSGILEDKDILHQLEKVLKIKPGEEIILFSGDGMEHRVKLVDYKKKGFQFEVLSSYEVKRSAKRKVVLACAVVKRDNFEWIVQKATEMGVEEIIPVIADRSVKLGLQTKRLVKIATEAAEQSGRGTVPEIKEPVLFRDVFRDTEKYKKIFLDFSDHQFFPSGDTTPVMLLIGPEGGWNDAERKIAEENGCLVLSLGSLVFRAETAAVAAGYIATNL